MSLFKCAVNRWRLLQAFQTSVYCKLSGNLSWFLYSQGLFKFLKRDQNHKCSLLIHIYLIYKQTFILGIKNMFKKVKEIIWSSQTHQNTFEDGAVFIVVFRESRHCKKKRRLVFLLENKPYFFFQLMTRLVECSSRIICKTTSFVPCCSVNESVLWTSWDLHYFQIVQARE